MTFLTYKDPRWDDVYKIYHENGCFVQAERFLDRANTQPLSYDSVAELPAHVQPVVEQLLAEVSPCGH